MRRFIFVLGIMTSCTNEPTEKSQNNGDPGASRDTTSSSGPYELQEQTWIVTDRVFTSDPCGIEGFIMQGGPGTLLDFVPDSDHGFTIERDGNPDHCVIDGESFRCEVRTDLDNTPQDFDMDATILVDVEIQGAFYEVDKTQMSVHYALNCDGPDYAVLTDLLGGQLECDLETESILETYVR